MSHILLCQGLHKKAVNTYFHCGPSNIKVPKYCHAQVSLINIDKILL